MALDCSTSLSYSNNWSSGRRNFVPEPRGPFCASNWSKSLKPGACPLLGPALSPGSLLVKVLGRLIAVLVASSVPLRAGCGRPETELLLSNDCSCTAFGSFSSDCAVERSISLSTELTSGCSTLG